MKAIVITLGILPAFIACGGNSEPDNQKTSLPIAMEQISKSDTTINFETMQEGKPAVGFTQSFTGKKQALQWQIVSDAGNKVVVQMAKNEGDYYNLLVLDNPAYQNFSMSVKIKAIVGDEDQGGGLVWRYIDNNNYYIARYNPLENNFRFYCVTNGNRKQLKSANINISTNEWFTLSVTMNGNTITCSLNGIKLIETTDDTFTKAGRMGLWTKADAVTYFDDLKIEP